MKILVFTRRYSQRMRLLVLAGILPVSFALSQVEAQANPFSIKKSKPPDNYQLGGGKWVPGDFDGNGKADFLHIPDNVRTGKLGFWSVGEEGAFLKAVFEPLDYHVSQGDWLAGDFNADRKTDLCHIPRQGSAGDVGAEYAYIWTSKGDGEFHIKPYRPRDDYPISTGEWLSGDFDRNGAADLAHIVREPGADNRVITTVHLWLFKDGGPFKIVCSSITEDDPASEALWLQGDFNGDRRDDLCQIITNSREHAKDRFILWLANTDGTFEVKSYQPWAGYTLVIRQWLSGDYDGDGKTDLLNIVGGRDYVRMWRSVGDGTFEGKEIKLWKGYNNLVPAWVTGDFDRDGKTDLVHAPKENIHYVNIWRSIEKRDFDLIRFSPAGEYSVSNGVWLAGDMNGDGKQDILHVDHVGNEVNSWFSTLPAPSRILVRRDNLAVTPVTDSPAVEPAKQDAQAQSDQANPGEELLVQLPAPGEVYLEGLEITQAVQNLENSVPLIANKVAIVRAYLTAQSPFPLFGIKGILSLRAGSNSVQIESMDLHDASAPPDPCQIYDVDCLADLSACRGSHSTRGIIVDPELRGKFREERYRLSSSLIFRIEASQLPPGQLTVELTSVTAGTTNLACSNCATSAVTRPLRETKRLRIRIVEIPFSHPRPKSKFLERYEVMQRDRDFIKSWLQRAFPVAAVDIKWSVDKQVRIQQPSFADALKITESIKKQEEGNRETYDAYYGAVPVGCIGGFSGGQVRGQNYAVGPVGDICSSVMQNNETFAWDPDGVFSDWYAGHEIAHIFKRQHRGLCQAPANRDRNPKLPPNDAGIISPDNSFMGFDIGDESLSLPMKVMEGASWNDVMTYCRNQWISDYTYEALFDELKTSKPVFSNLIARREGSALHVRRVSHSQPLSKRPPAFEANRQGVKPQIKRLSGKPEQPAPQAPGVIALQVDVPEVKESGPAQAPKSIHQSPEPSKDQVPRVQYDLSAPATDSEVMPAATDMKERAIDYVKGDFLSVKGTLSTPDYLLEDLETLPVSSAPKNPEIKRSDLFIRSLDSQGVSLGEQPLELHAIELESRLTEDTGSTASPESELFFIEGTVRRRPGTARLQIIRRGDASEGVAERILKEITVGVNPPTVGNLREKKGEPEPASDDSITLEWDGADSDDDELTYSVEISSDNGRSWMVVSGGIREMRLTLDQSQQIGSVQIKQLKRLKVRVSVSDGFNLTRSNPLTIR